MVLARAIRRALVACGVLAIGIPGAHAQSLKDGPAPVPVFTWSGAYFGLHAGWGWADVNWRNDYPYGNSSTRPRSFDIDSPVYGGQLGIQTQRGNWVFGAETSLSGFTDRERTRGIDLWAGNRVGDMTARVDWLFMAVGRVGYTWGNTLGYVKGGYAGAEVRLETNDNVPPIYTSTSSKWHNGWTIGTGVEYLWLPNITVGVEYNFVSLESTNRDTFISGPSTRFNSRADLDIHTVLARMNFKFDFLNTP